jgi:hypothetical protein
MKNSTTADQLSKRISQLNSLIQKFPNVRSLIRRWGFELTQLEGRLEALKAVAVAVVESPRQLTIFEIMNQDEIKESPIKSLRWVGDEIGPHFKGVEIRGRKGMISLEVYGAQYERKEAIKALGAKWDALEKQWYVFLPLDSPIEEIQSKMELLVVASGFDKKKNYYELANERSPRRSELCKHFESLIKS